MKFRTWPLIVAAIILNIFYFVIQSGAAEVSKGKPARIMFYDNKYQLLDNEREIYNPKDWEASAVKKKATTIKELNEQGWRLIQIAPLNKDQGYLLFEKAN